MRLSRFKLVQLVVLVGLAIYLAFVVLSGRWAYYIDPRFQWLSVVAVFLLGTLAVSYLMATEEDEVLINDPLQDDHTQVMPISVLVLAIPLVLGIAIRAEPLGANAIKTRGIDTDYSSISLASASSRSLTIIPSERNVLDWARAIASTDDIAEFNDQEAKVVGFVYRDSRFADDQFMVSRFTLSCCVADALAIGLVVQLSPDAPDYAVDTWVEVEGVFQETEFDGSYIPVLYATSIKPVEQPDQPYLYQ